MGWKGCSVGYGVRQPRAVLMAERTLTKAEAQRIRDAFAHQIPMPIIYPEREECEYCGSGSHKAKASDRCSGCGAA